MKHCHCGAELVEAEYVSGATSEDTATGLFCEDCQDWFDEDFFDENEALSRCCSMPFYENTDICTGCGEHG